MAEERRTSSAPRSLRLGGDHVFLEDVYLQHYSKLILKLITTKSLKAGGKAMDTKRKAEKTHYVFLKYGALYAPQNIKYNGENGKS